MKCFTPIILLVTALALSACGHEDLTTEERNLAISMRLSQAPEMRADPSNAVSVDPRAVTFGKALFFDVGLSASGSVACASCHVPDLQFQDGLPLAVAAGINTRRTMPLAGIANDNWFFWDGRKDSLWSQALAPLENSVEHATDRKSVVRHVLTAYESEYQALFSSQGVKAADINLAFSNIGKAIAAYVATIKHEETRFDRVMESWASESNAEEFSADELKGLKIFLGKGNCVSCHTGPRFSDGFFHNTGVPEVVGLPSDNGRLAILKDVKSDPFNCLGSYSDAKPEDCGELRFMSTDSHELERAFKTPSLRGVAERAPYMHAGQFKTLEEVVRHYVAAPKSPSGHSEAVPLDLDNADVVALKAFLKTLN